MVALGEALAHWPDAVIVDEGLIEQHEEEGDRQEEAAEGDIAPGNIYKYNCKSVY